MNTVETNSASPCSSPADALPKEEKPSIGLALSGGGFRATLFHLGVIRLLRDAGLLPEVTTICCVSGGSVLGAHLVANFASYSTHDFETAAQPILALVRADIRNRIARRIPHHLLFSLLFSRLRRFCLSSTDLLTTYYGDYLYYECASDGTSRVQTLDALRSTEACRRPKLYILTTDLATGALCSFTATGFYDSIGRRYRAAHWSLARAVAASSAFPGFFSPVLIDRGALMAAPLEPIKPHALTDGGVHDNLGVRQFALLSRDAANVMSHIIVSDASLEFNAGLEPELSGPVKTALRAADILGHRLYQLDLDYFQNRFKQLASESVTTVLIDIRTIVGRSSWSSVYHASDSQGDTVVPLHEDAQAWLPFVRTDFDRFSEQEINALVSHGYCVARQQLWPLIPQNKRDSVKLPWRPFPEASQGDLRAQVATLRGSTGRTVRFFDCNDPVSLAHLAVFASVVAILCFLMAPRRPAKTIHIAVLRSGDLAYTRHIEDGFRDSLQASETALNVKFEFISRVGPEEAPDSRGHESWSDLVQWISQRDKQTPFQYYAPIGTQATRALKINMANTFGTTPVVFLGVTYPKETGVVSAIDARQEATNVTGVGYGNGVAAVAETARTLFPGRTLLYLYWPEYSQDAVGADELRRSDLCRDGTLRVVATDKYPTVGDMADEGAVYFSWYTFEKMFEEHKGSDVLKERIVVATTRANVESPGEAVACVSTDDEEIGQLGADIVLAHIRSGGKEVLGHMDVKVPRFAYWLNLSTAKTRGVRFSDGVVKGAKQVYGGKQSK